MYTGSDTDHKSDNSFVSVSQIPEKSKDFMIMTDIFDAKILCNKCNEQMEKSVVHKGGFALRVASCPVCKDKIVHPEDKNKLEHFKDLKGKTFHVKLRMVGNSHAISIPKEIVNFINEMHRNMKSEMDDMVRLCFEDFGRLSVRFDDGREVDR